MFELPSLLSDIFAFGLLQAQLRKANNQHIVVVCGKAHAENLVNHILHSPLKNQVTVQVFDSENFIDGRL